MAGKLEGKVAYISGGTSGIGAATAELFASEGAQVVITGRSEEKGSNLADELGDRVIYQHADVSVEADIKRTLDFTSDTFGRLDVVFNNAGGPTAGDVTNITSGQIDYGVKLL
ncbi:MAG: SDR family NAD(P)-dependent oxidoreductase, partial [Gammaproteobacteria bacterium]|nr:SDR family NAD(P)-dependent oxidoreductase [Gammaproteobacteria bacterium]